MPDFTIPTVDISPYLNVEADPNDRLQVVSQIREAALTSGFFQITGHQIPRVLQRSVFDAARQLFALPTSTKATLQSVNGRGYEVIGGQTLDPAAKPDLKEGYFVGPSWVDTDDHNPPYEDFEHPNRWPSDDVLSPAAFRDPLLEYQARMCDLAKAVMQILSEGLTAPDLPPANQHTHEQDDNRPDATLFDSFCARPLALLRLLHYPPQPPSSTPDQFGAGAHTDFGAITLLLQETQAGLQVLDAATQTWIDVAPNPDAYVVNVGDMLDMWTQGVYRSNVHRVVNAGVVDRYSVPFFFDGRLDYVLRPLGLDSVRTRVGARVTTGNVTMDEAGLTVREFLRARYRKTYG